MKSLTTIFAGYVLAAALGPAAPSGLQVAEAQGLRPEFLRRPMCTNAINVGVHDITCPQYGAVLDARTVSDGAISAGSQTLTSTAGMTGITAGMLVEIEGAGSGGALHVTTVQSVGSPNSVTITTAAVTGVSNAHTGWGTNNAVALADAVNACDAAGGGTVFIPEGTGYVSTDWSGSPSVLTNIEDCTITGAGWGSVLKWLHMTNGNNGQVIRFTLSSNLRFTNFTIDLNNGKRAGKSSSGIQCNDGCEDIEVTGMHFFSSRATAAVTGSDKDQWAVLFGAPISPHKNINVHHNFVEDQLQFECHLKCENLKFNHNIMINEVASPKTTAAIWMGTEVNTGGNFRDIEVCHNTIKGYSNRGINYIHNGVDNSSTGRRIKICNNQISYSGSSGGSAGIFAGVGNTSVTYNQPIVMEDIEVSGNQIYSDTTADFRSIFFNNNQSNTGFFFERPVVVNNSVARVSNLNNSANDGISISSARKALVTNNRAYGTRFGYRLGITESLIANNYQTGILDSVDAVSTFNCMLIIGGNNEIRDNYCGGVYDDAAIWEVTSGVSDNRFIGNRIDASATAGILVTTGGIGMIVADTWISGAITTGISRTSTASGGRMQVYNTQFGPTHPTTYFGPGTTHPSDSWQLADSTQEATIEAGSPGTLTVVPHYRNIDVTNTDAGGELTISEAQAAEGMVIEIFNVGTVSFDVKHIAGQFETLSTADTALAAKKAMTARYVGGSWYQTQ